MFRQQPAEIDNFGLLCKLEVTVARELLPYNLHLDYTNYLLMTKKPTDVNIVQILHLSISFESKQTSWTVLDIPLYISTSYFTKRKSSKYEQSICSH